MVPRALGPRPSWEGRHQERGLRMGSLGPGISRGATDAAKQHVHETWALLEEMAWRETFSAMKSLLLLLLVIPSGSQRPGNRVCCGCVKSRLPGRQGGASLPHRPTEGPSCLKAPTSLF